MPSTQTKEAYMNRASVLSLVLNHGREIFGKEFPKGGTEGLRWLSDKARQGCPLSRQLLGYPTEESPSLAAPAVQSSTADPLTVPLMKLSTGTTRNIFLTITVLALFFSTSATMAADRSYELGMEAATNYRYAEALMHFQAAAERGDQAAQRNLGLMLLYGERLYGNDVRRDHEQAKRWLQTASDN